ncbi:GNAT family N-acetyltransferase [Streptomyces sp. BI20]|uniref:GNAT family N-acetyltransferase n=1 Tax=Streptomyces sp. BI20 TaxID=3403460 RepID=UPI003C779B3F
MFSVRQALPADGVALGDIHSTAWAATYAPFFAADFAAEGIASRRHTWHARIARTLPPPPTGASDPRTGVGSAPAGPGEPTLRDAGTILVAEDAGRLLALSWFRASGTGPDEVEILSFFNHPAGWGTGIAGALMTATLARSAEEGFRHVRLWTLRDTPRSRRFYEKCGFALSGADRPHDFGDGEPLVQVEYRRALSAP